MRTELNPKANQATLDAIARFKTHDPELQKQYEIEFVLTPVTGNWSEADLVSFLTSVQSDMTK